jgi:uncharacterized zinc-type alcohol dehydrogenase-like protein
MPFYGYAAPAQGAALEEHSFEPKELGHDDVEIKITHCGVCHTDIHLIDNDWGNSRYPLVPGHEIVGEVAAVGSSVRHLKAGQRVGVGFQAGACLECDRCVRGDENLCARSQPTCIRRPGGFADRIRVSGHFAFPIPEALDSGPAAPLLCAGVTVYAPLRHFGILPAMRVGIVGIGGVGHLGIQYARAFGCEVTVFSTTPDKEPEARAFGAHRFISLGDAGAMKGAADSLDFILSTVHAELNWAQFITMLRANGKLCFVGAPPQPVSIPVGLLLGGRKSICGSLVGGRAMMREALELAARHGIKAKIEVVPIADVNAAIDKVRKNRARYRMVLAA